MTKLAHGLGYKGSVGGSLTKKLRALIPDIDVLLKGATGSAKVCNDDGKAGATKPKVAEKAPKGKAAKSKWPRNPRNPFREGALPPFPI